MVEAENVLKPMLKKIAEKQEYNDDSTEVTLIHSEGVNCTSKLYNITLSAPSKDDIKLFAKVAALGEEFRSITTMQIFEIETMFYTTVLSQYRDFEEKYKFPIEDRLIVPKFYGASTDYMQEVLVLEELTAKGYQPFDRFKCYDWEYASKCVSFLARFHALSVRYEIDKAEEFTDMIQKLSYEYPVDETKKFTEKVIEAAIEETPEEYKERLTTFITENMTAEKFKVYYDNPRKVVLSHGDFRPSNIMHKTNDDGQLEISAVDYQGIKKGNPLVDLINFLICGSDEDFRRDHLDQYFDHYYKEFSRTLRMLEINPDEVYNRVQFDDDVKEMLPFAIIVSLYTLLFITVDVQDAPQVKDGFDFEKLIIKPSNYFHRRFGGIVRDFMKMGIL